MIRINLLPPAARRRRRRQPGREGSVLALMSLGWAALITAGYLWIAATAAEIADLRERTDALTAQTSRARAELNHAALSERQTQLHAAREALGRLRADRRNPGPLLAELHALVLAEDPAAADSPFAGRADARLFLTDLQQLERDRWSLAGSAHDLSALTGLMMRLAASPRVAAVERPEYARDEAGRLAFRVDLSTRD
jgi:Tfp pilus assembly protein PilN